MLWRPKARRASSTIHTQNFSDIHDTRCRGGHRTRSCWVSVFSGGRMCSDLFIARASPIAATVYLAMSSSRLITPARWCSNCSRSGFYPRLHVHSLLHAPCAAALPHIGHARAVHAPPLHAQALPRLTVARWSAVRDTRCCPPQSKARVRRSGPTCPFHATQSMSRWLTLWALLHAYSQEVATRAAFSLLAERACAVKAPRMLVPRCTLHTLPTHALARTCWHA